MVAESSEPHKAVHNLTCKASQVSIYKLSSDA